MLLCVSDFVSSRLHFAVCLLLADLGMVTPSLARPSGSGAEEAHNPQQGAEVEAGGEGPFPLSPWKVMVLGRLLMGTYFTK